MIFANSFATFAIKICSVSREAPLRLLRPTLLLLGIPFLSLAQTDPRIPPEVLHKSGYVNAIPKPADFTSAMLWGIAIADTRIPGNKKAVVEISRLQLSCRVEGKDIVLNDDTGNVRGGLYRRFPWFGTDIHDPMSVESAEIPTLSRNSRQGWGNRGEERAQIVILRVGSRTDRVWHFWAASPRAQIPAGTLEGCTVKVRAKISKGALLQVGFDYWRNPTVGYESGGNNHEAGASNWYFPSGEWQEAKFTDVHR